MLIERQLDDVAVPQAHQRRAALRQRADLFHAARHEDLAAIDRQRHEDFEVQVREVERQRQKIERLHAELNEKK